MIVKFHRSLLLLIFVLTNTSFFAQNILTNGDFESGGSGVGFVAGGFPAYSLATIAGTNVSGNYSFVTDPTLINSSFISGDTIFMNLNWFTLPFLRFTNFFKK